MKKAVADFVKNKTGVDITDYDIVLSNNYIAHIYDEHGSEATELPRGQLPVDTQSIQNIIESIIDPDDVSLTHGKNGDALNFEEVLNGRNVAITIASTKKNTLSLKSARIFKNSGVHSPSANANALASTPKANSRNSTTNSILDSDEKINPREKFSLAMPAAGYDSQDI